MRRIGQIFLVAAVCATTLTNNWAQQPGEKLWEFSTGSGIEQSPALASDGTIYVACGGLMSAINKLYALNPNGSKKWEVSAVNPFSTAPSRFAF